MRTDAVEHFLAQGLGLMDLTLDNESEALARLALYFSELLKWNRKINLVARTLNDRQILENHFLDSLTLLTLLAPDSRAREEILDVGTGAGFPGLVLKAACPKIQVTLVEPRKNRFFFLKHMVRALDLEGMKVLEARLEENVKLRELAGCRFSMITSRAFTDICRFIKIAAPYLDREGRIVMMKGPGGLAELDDLVRRGLPEQFYVDEKRKLLLPFTKAERWIISIGRASENST